MRRAPLVLATACAIALGGIRGHAEELVDRVLATVEGRLVTLSDVRTALRFGLVPSVTADPIGTTLDRLIDRLVILAEVERYVPPEPDPAVIRERVAQVRGRFSDVESFEIALRVAGMDERALAEWVRNDLRIARYLDERFAGAAEPTSEDVEDYVRRHQADLQQGGRALDDPEVVRLARERVAAERRAAVAAEWVRGLRARAGVSTTPPLP